MAAIPAAHARGAAYIRAMRKRILAIAGLAAIAAIGAGATIAQADPPSSRSPAELRAQVVAGLERNAPAEARRAALESIDGLGEAELDAALKLLEGKGGRPNLLASDGEVRLRLFKRLAACDPGQRTLVEFAVRDEGAVRGDALASLREPLSPQALAAVHGFLASDRELHINRAAMIGSAYAPALLIPELIQAQTAPPRRTRGDEAWIALGKSVTYIGGLIPVVGDGSGAFQPVPATIFEGTVFRISDSVVTVYRTEVHGALIAAVERTTGEPAPAFGFDQQRWAAWHRDEYPALAAQQSARLREEAIEREGGERRVADEG